MTSKPSKKELKKAKAEAEKQKTQMLNTKRRVLEDSRAVANLMDLIPFLQNFNHELFNAQIKSFNKVPEEYELWMFNMITQNMEKFYEKAWGWDAEVKEAELYHEDSRFLIAFYRDHPIGFVHFRYELDTGELSLFIYDIHVTEELRRQGLGKFLLQAVEFIGLKLGYDSVIVSCFKDCTVGRQFFNKYNYKLHKQSPAIADPENEFEYHHKLLFKPLKKQ